MEKEAFKKLMLQMVYFLGAYMKEFIIPKVKEAFDKSKAVFVEALWDSMKDDLHEQVKSAVEYIERFFNTPEYEIKEKAILDIVFNNIELPLLAKPFKPIIRNMLKSKIREVIKSTIKKLNQQV